MKKKENILAINCDAFEVLDDSECIFFLQKKITGAEGLARFCVMHGRCLDIVRLEELLETRYYKYVPPATTRRLLALLQHLV